MELTINEQAHEVEQVTIVCSMLEAHLLSVACDTLIAQFESDLIMEQFGTTQTPGVFETSLLASLGITRDELYEAVDTLITTLPGIPDEEEV